jgi:hypothetical protein
MHRNDASRFRAKWNVTDIWYNIAQFSATPSGINKDMPGLVQSFAACSKYLELTHVLIIFDSEVVARDGTNLRAG